MATPPSTPAPSRRDGRGEPLEAGVREALASVADPCLAAAGIGGSVLDLGLVQDLRLDDAGRVEIDLSLTEMGCAFTHHLLDTVARRVEAVDGVTSVTVVPTWTWRREHMSDALGERLRASSAELPGLLHT